MCGRFANATPPDDMRQTFGTIGALYNAAPSWNIAPRQQAPVVRRHPKHGDRRLDLLTWGLVPHWATDLAQEIRPINAQAERVASSRMFRGAFERRRCLVPADLYYEWEGPKGAKQPFAIARRDGAQMGLAALWESWTDPAGEILRTFVILTTSANATTAELHHRMPVILEPEDWPAWLGETDGGPAELLHPAHEDVLRYWPVSKSVGKVTNNGPELIEPIREDHL